MGSTAGRREGGFFRNLWLLVAMQELLSEHEQSPRGRIVFCVEKNEKQKPICIADSDDACGDHPKF